MKRIRVRFAVASFSLAVAGVLWMLVLVVPASAAPPTSPTPTPSAASPTPDPTPVSVGPCDLPALSTVCSVAGHLPNPVQIVTGAAESSFTQWLADGAASVLGNVIAAADNDMEPDLSPGSFLAGRLQTMAGLAGGVSLLFLLLAVGQALLRGDPRLMVTALLRLPLAFAVTVVGLVILLLAAAAPLVLLGLVAHAEHAVGGLDGVRRVAYAPPQQAAGLARRAATAAAAGATGGAAGAGGVAGEADAHRRLGRSRAAPVSAHHHR